MKRLQQNSPRIDKFFNKKNKNESKKEYSASSDEEKDVKRKTSKITKPNLAQKVSFLSLESSINDKTMQVYKDDRFVCIRDKYPKSRLHLLLIPLSPRLTKVQDLIKLPNAIDLLKLMKSTSSKIIESNVPSTIDKTKINYGFHAVQSMNPLHMHIISNDFQSDCLKNKKHWNSFTTPYFIHLDPLISHLDSLKEDDYFKQDKFNLNNKSKLESYLKMDLKCHVCQMAQSNMPNLKKHLQTH